MKRFGRYEEVHSVADLLRIVREFIPMDESIILMGNRPDSFYIPTRYPNAWPTGAPHKRYVKRDAEEAVSYASTIFRFVEESIR
jgi:HEPN domain-containing protein